MNKRDMHFSKFISLVLRHKPQEIGLQLSGDGYVGVKELLEGMNKKGMDITREDLDRIIAEDDKQRYSYNFLGGEHRVRANQGHSIPVDLSLELVVSPLVLYHGTGQKFLPSIINQGIKKGNRQYVHLSSDIETATKVGNRHGEARIFKIDVERMMRDNYLFYRSENGVYLTDYIPTKYICLVCKVDII